jgi:D-amino peptidase
VTSFYISFDLEGMGCVTHGDQIPDEGLSGELRELVTAELNAVIAGASAAGGTRFLVNDSHSRSHNCIPSLLDPRAEYIGGWGQPMTTVEAMDQSYDGVFLVGQHAMAGHGTGDLSHTWIPKWLYGVRLNGQPVGEIGLNALLAGRLGVPVALVTGDEAACREASDLLGNVETAIVKQSISRQSARLMHPNQVRGLLTTSAERAVHRLQEFRPYRPDPPFRMELEWTTPMFAQLTAMIPGASASGPRTTAFEADDVMTTYRFFFAATFLSMAFEDRLF